MTEYHFRRPERMIEDRPELLEIIAGQQIMTLALCQDNQPYLVTVDYAFDPDRNCFYFHSALQGKKVDVLADNPVVWGQVLEDRGYLDGKCDHAYRTVQFSGRVEFLEDLDEKRRALHLLVKAFESDPQPVIEKLRVEKRLTTIGVGKVQVEFMSGKKALPG